MIMPLKTKSPRRAQKNYARYRGWIHLFSLVLALSGARIVLSQGPTGQPQPPKHDGVSITPPAEVVDQSQLRARHERIHDLLQCASREFNIPLPILEGVAFVESRWNQTIPPEERSDLPQAYGVMGLRDDEWFGHTLVDAARLIDQKPDVLKRDPKANIRGGAAVLAKLAANARARGVIVDGHLKSWRPIMQTYSGIHDPDLAAAYARRALELLHNGYDKYGIYIASSPELDISVSSKQGNQRAPTGYPNAIWVGPPPSGNYQPGRGGNSIGMVILHTTEGTAQSAIDWFLNPQSQVSAQYIVAEDGTIWQVVSDSDTAYHAGSFIYNEQSIGIEMEGYADGQDGDFSWQTQAQYNSVQGLISWLSSQYSIPLDRAHLIGHNQVPDTDCGTDYWGGCGSGDHTPHHDPGAWWNWNTLMTSLQHPPNYSEVVIQSLCAVYALPQINAPYITFVWPGQKFVIYDSANGYDLIFLTGEEAAEPPNLPAGEYHWDAWVPSNCVNQGGSDAQFQVSGVFPEQLRVHDDTNNSPPIALTIDGKRYIGTGNSQTGFDGYIWYQYYLGWDTAPQSGWSSGAYLVPLSNNTFSITGQVTLNGAALKGVMMTLSGGSQAYTTTDVNGDYNFYSLPGGVSYTVTPSLSGYNFTPTIQSFNPLNQNQLANFVASLNNNNYTISGQVTLNGVGLGGVTMTLEGGVQGSTTTNLSGSYSFSGLPGGGNYFITPFLSGYSFNPAVVNIDPLNSNQVENFVSSPGFYSISGQVILNGSGLPGVMLTLSGPGEWNGYATTDMFGNYSFSRLPGGVNYQVVPSLLGYSFNPSGWGFDPLDYNEIANFTASLAIYSLSVTLSGSGSGTVSSSPSGINCQPTCVANFNSGTVVTLTTTPSTGSTFAGWNGACNGTGLCVISMSANESVTASFNLTTAGAVVFASGTISTLAGNGTAGYSGDGGPAAAAEMNTPLGVAINNHGTIYLADFDNERVRAVNTTSSPITIAGVVIQPGAIETVVGTGQAGFFGDGGAPTGAQIWAPTGLVVDAAGNLYIADTNNSRIRAVNTQSTEIQVLGVDIQPGTIQTVAGNGVEGYSGDGGSAINAELGYPQGMALDAAGDLYIADWANTRIRMVAFATGVITTIAGGGNGCGQAVDGLGDGCPAIDARLSFPVAIAIDSFNNVFISDSDYERIRIIYEGGTIAGLSNPQVGYIYTLAGGGGGCSQQTDSAGDGCLSTEVGPLLGVGLTLDSGGALYIADSFSSRLRRIDRITGIVTAVAGTGTSGYSGDGGPATSAELSLDSFWYGSVLTIDGSDNLYFGDSSNNRIRSVSAVAAPMVFPTLIVGQTSPAQIISLEDAGDVPLTIDSITITGGNSSDFTITNQSNCPVSPASLGAGGSCTISITFDPTSNGMRSSFLSINSNAANFPQVDVPLSGLSAQTTTTTLTSSVNPSSFNQPVTFTASVSGGSGMPTGTVSFYDGNILLGTGTLNNAVAQFTVSTLGIGNHSVTGIYSGDSNFAGSTSSPLNQVVQQAYTTVSLSSNMNPSFYDQAITFTAAITAQYGGNTTGMVTFYDGTTQIGSGQINNNTATLTTSALSTGKHSITAVYSGDTNFTGATSAALTQNVSQASTSTVLTSSPNPSSYDQAATFTATVAGQYGGTPTGNVTFYNGQTPLGMATLSNGSASLQVSNMPVGAESITTVYAGDSNFNGSTSPVLTQNVNQASTTTALTSSPDPSSFEQTVTFTATVTGKFGGVPTGTVTFYDQQTKIGTETLNDGSATLQVATLQVGAHSITAVYGGDTNFTGSTSPALTQTVNRASTTTTLTSSPNPSKKKQVVTFAATVKGQYGGTPTGSVTFQSGAKKAVAKLNNKGMASATTSKLAVGQYKVTTSYPGDLNFTASTSNTITQVVNP